MSNIDVGPGSAHAFEGPPSTAKGGEGAVEHSVDPGLVRGLLTAIEHAQPKENMQAHLLTEKTDDVRRVDQLYRGVMTFVQVAKEHGMSRPEIDQHIQFIAKNLSTWVQGAQDLVVKSETHTIQFLKETGTIVTHFKGTCLGEGQFAKVKEGIVSASLSIPIGTPVARKIAKTEVADLAREGAITQLFSSSENVRKCHVVNQKGLLLEGMDHTLKNKLEGGELSFEEILTIARQLANGLVEIHGKNYVHNDLKTDNCFISPLGVVKIGDLGSASEAGKPNERPVNLNIASPQQLAGQLFNAPGPAKGSDDIFSFGQLLYALEHGKLPPFSNKAELFKAKIDERNSCLKEINALPAQDQEKIYLWNGKDTLPGGLQGLAERLVAVKSDLRALYQEHLDEISTFLGGYQPETPLGHLAKQMMQLNPERRLTAEEASSELQTMTASSAVSHRFEKQEKVNESSGYIQGALVGGYAGGIQLDDIPASTGPAMQVVSDPGYSGIYAFIPKPVVDSVDSDHEKLLKAVWKSDVETLTQLLKKGVDICGFRDDKGCTLLHLAMRQHNHDIVTFLCKLGADVNAKDHDGLPPLFYAVKEKNVESGKILINYGADLEVENSIGMPLFTYDDSGMEIQYLENGDYVASGLRFLDENKLLLGEAKGKVDSAFMSWFQNQATTLEFARTTPGVSDAAKQKLTFLSLQAFDKAAAHGESRSKKLGFQMSPLFPSDNRYHRSTGSEMIGGAQRAFQDALMPFGSGCGRLVHSPLVAEVLERYMPKDTEILSISDPQDLVQVLEALKKNDKRGENNPLLVDFSKFVANHGGGKEALKQVSDLWREFINQNPDVYLDRLGILPFCLCEHEGQHLLMTFKYNDEVQNKIADILRHTGFVLSPDEVKEAYLKVSNLEAVLRTGKDALPIATPATSAAKIPAIYDSILGLFKTNAFRQFSMMAESPAATPYQRALAAGTMQVLMGLSKHPANQNPQQNGIEAVFKKHGLEDFLQISYSKIQMGLANATFKKTDLVAFLNAIEQVHQEVQNILAILSLEGGYSEEVFGEAVALHLTEGEEPVVPAELGIPHVQLKPSAMHGFSSALASVEAQKGTSEVNVVMLKDTYYEEADVVSSARGYTVSVLDGDTFQQDPASCGFNDLPKKPVDLFVCEFHHNISLTRQKYTPENVRGQILAMHEKGLLAKPCTVLIDTTIDLEKSDQMRELLHDPKISSLIKEGALNFVFLRSGQKFDMLGLDNYYGGITATVNNGRDFSAFNERMQRAEDQQAGLSYQGMTHLQLHAKDAIENYRRLVMENCQRLYSALPEKIVYSEGGKNPIQVSAIEDNRLVFLDIKFPAGDKLSSAFYGALFKYAETEKLPLTQRSSFGFATTNVTLIKAENGCKVRINPGLESAGDIAKYARFFELVQKAVEEVMQQSTGKSEAEVEKLLCHALRHLG